MSFTERPFGTVGSAPALAYTLKNAKGSLLEVTDFGATVTQLHLPDREGRFADVVLGFDDVAGYAAGCPFFGATIGRVANRIARGRFALGGKAYELKLNDPPHHLHGGPLGWDKVLWRLDEAHSGDDCVSFVYRSPAGEEGYPGEVNARVRYRLSDDDEFEIWMRAECSETTLVNMAHHGYWNLAGHVAPSVLNHELMLHSDEYTPGDPVVPNGEVAAVSGTPFDFRRPKRLGADIDAVGPTPAGYDHNFVVRGEAHRFRPVLELFEPLSGRHLELWANQPGVQLYSGNFLDGSIRGKGSVAYGHRAAVCLETQGFPNAINVPAWQSQVVLAPGEPYEHRMLHRFSAR
jgi:aldose 1-epimerase